MIIEFYHGYMTLERLNDMIGISSHGTSAYQLIETAKKLGFRAYGIEQTELTEAIHLPAIAHIKTPEGYYHYVVIYKINEKQQTVLVADPAKGMITMTMDTFYHLWTHILCIFYPIRTLPILDKKYTLTDIILPVIKPFHKLLWKIILLSIIYGSFSMITNFYVTMMIDSIPEKHHSLLWMIFGIMVIVYMLKNVTDYFRNRILLLFHERMTLFFVLDILKRLIFLPYQYYQNRTTGEVLSKLNELSHLQTYIEKGCVFLSFDCPLFLLSCYVLFQIDANLFWFHTVILLFDFGVWFFLKRSYKKRQYELQLVKANTNQVVTESLMAFESIKGLHLEKNVLARISKHYLLFIKREIHCQLLYFRHQLLRINLQELSTALSIFSLTFLIMENKHTIGEIVTFQTFIGYIMMTLTKASELIVSYEQAKVAVEQLSFLFQKEETTVALQNVIKGKIEFQNFYYTLGQGDVLFEECNLTIEHRGKVLLLGSSGSGKSTLLKILMGYYEIDRGQVWIDGIDLRDYAKESIRDAMIYVTQNGTLFTDTLYYNIVLNRKIDGKALDDIIKLCAIDQIMKKRGTDLSMRLEENGMNLSGGERQRILLARSLLAPFQILLIDEGLSQVDQKLEEVILKRLFLKYYDKTIILVSHRREYPLLFHQILEIQNKRIEVIT